ncbi:MAG TPA: site-specific DNA-methyltransferase, partial [Propionibacteriaceae bacterium]
YTPAAARWQGWGTALKPAFEPIVVGRKPLAGTVAANVLAYGTGALNVDGCRVGTDEKIQTAAGSTPGAWIGPVVSGEYEAGTGREYRTGGRWPTNVILDDSQAAELDRQSGVSTSRANDVSDERIQRESSSYGIGQGRRDPTNSHTDSGGASRFFPTFSHHECEVCGEDTTGWHRDARDEHALAHEGKPFPTFHYEAKAPTSERPRHDGTAHPTVKPLDLMRWLVRLVTPPGGTVLEPFAGSGTTAEACVIEGFKCIAIEREATYLPLIMQRLSKDIAVTLDFGGEAS